MEAAATVNVSGNAKIDGCESIKYGGGIYTLGTCTISENAEISNCEGTYGGGIFIGKNNTTISGNANIHDNVATLNGCALCSGGDGANLIVEGGRVHANYSKAVIATTNAGAKFTITGGWLWQEGSGTYFSSTKNVNFIIEGGYYKPNLTTSLVKSPFAIKDNPQLSSEDIAAFEAGYTKKVMK